MSGSARPRRDHNLSHNCLGAERRRLRDAIVRHLISAGSASATELMRRLGERDRCRIDAVLGELERDGVVAFRAKVLGRQLPRSLGLYELA